MAAFVAMGIIAAFLYPGGHWWDRQAEGFDPLRNFWCDMLRERGLDGDPNPGAPVMKVAMGVFGIGLVPFWWLLSLRFPRQPRFGFWVCWLGWLGSVGFVAVALMPSDAFPVLHGVLTLSAGLAGIAAAVLGVIALATTSNSLRSEVWLGLALTGAALLNAIQYARQFAFGAPDTLLLPMVQKSATVLLLAWITVVSLNAKRRAHHEDPT